MSDILPSQIDFEACLLTLCGEIRQKKSGPPGPPYGANSCRVMAIVVEWWQ